MAWVAIGKTQPMALERNYDLAQRMAELARTVASPRSVEDVLSDVTATALELIEGADSRGRPAAKQLVESSIRSPARRICRTGLTHCR